MKKPVLFLLATVAVILLAGCSLSSDEKLAREKGLQQSVLAFVADVVQPNWQEAYRLTDGSLGGPDQLKNQLSQSWVQDATLTNGDVTSMAWVNDSTAKVKLTWSFQAGSVETFSSETFLWIWKGDGWKYKGRALR